MKLKTFHHLQNDVTEEILTHFSTHIEPKLLLSKKNAINASFILFLWQLFKMFQYLKQNI